jgi:uncharacterized membrane protein
VKSLSKSSQTSSSLEEERFVEIDMLRGLAIAVMVAFHFWWDLAYYGMSSLNTQVYWYAQICPIVFFCIVGISLVLSARRKTLEQMIYRGILIFAFGCCISAISLVVIPDKPVTFGVLHCIGLSMIVGAFMVKLDKRLLFSLSLPIIALGKLISEFRVPSPNYLQLIVGFHQPYLERYTVDYFPMLPWFGIMVFGMALCGVLYKDGARQFPFPDISRYVPVRLASWLGRHSLTIYLAHQPVIAGTILYIIPLVSRYLPNI